MSPECRQFMEAEWNARYEIANGGRSYIRFDTATFEEFLEEFYKLAIKQLQEELALRVDYAADARNLSYQLHNARVNATAWRQAFEKLKHSQSQE